MEENIGGLRAAAKAVGEFASRNGIKTSYGFQAKTFEGDQAVVIKAQRFDGKLTQTGALLIFRNEDHLRVAEPGEITGCGSCTRGLVSSRIHRPNGAIPPEATVAATRAI